VSRDMKVTRVRLHIAKQVFQVHAVDARGVPSRSVTITGKDSGRLVEAKTALGGKVETLTSNVARVGDIEAMAAEAKTKLGWIDVLFVNAGVALPTPFEAVSESQYDDQFNVNIKGAFFTVQKLLPLLKDGASVILTSSTADEMGLPGLSVYCASKAALRSLVRSLTAELSSRRIRVNSIAPGPTDP
jgi:NAD(P)-dependent dehydrogenase (short-subunit alcohol dehydrogenase family)